MKLWEVTVYVWGRMRDSETQQRMRTYPYLAHARSEEDAKTLAAVDATDHWHEVKTVHCNAQILLGAVAVQQE